MQPHWSFNKHSAFLCYSQASPELADTISQMLTNHGPLVKVRPSAAVVGIPFKRQGSLDGGQLSNVLTGQVQLKLLPLSYPQSQLLTFYLVSHVGASPGNLSLPLSRQKRNNQHYNATRKKNGSFSLDYLSHESTSYCDKFNTTKRF